MSRVKDALVSAVVLLVGRAAPSARPDREPLVEQGSPSPGWEVVVLILLALVAGCAIVFMVLFSFEGLAHQTQYLGLALGAAFVLLAAICIVVANKLIVTEELEEDYPDLEHSAESDDVEQVVVDSGSRFTRGRLVKLAGFGALGTLGLALITPALSLGPAFATQKLKWTPWRRGRRLVDSQGAPLKASDIEAGSFYTAYPEGADRELIGSPIVVVRVPLADLKSRHDWAPQGIVAFSKICTHAGCAISLYRKPTFVPVEPRPALVCPCHYSTFDPATGGTVTFGPAGRKLPMLPVYVDQTGVLRAGGNFDGPVGPSWWGVRLRGPSP